MRAAWRARAASIALAMIFLRSFGCSWRNSASFWLTTCCTKPRTHGLPSFVFVCPSNCGSRSFSEITAARPSRTSSPSRFASFSLSCPSSRANLLIVEVSAASKPEQVRAALDRVDVVREREDGVGRVLRVPLQRDLDRAATGVVVGLEVGDRRVDRVLLGVDVPDEVADTALVVELLRPLAAALVGEADAEPTRQERGLAQPLPQRVARQVELLEYLRVGEERDGRPRVVLVGGARDLEVRHRVAARELLPVDLPVPPHLRNEPLGERVDDGDADAVEAAGDLVAVAAELAARVQLREHDGRAPRDPDPRSGRRESRAPWSTTVTEWSGCSRTSTKSLRPASASSTALSTTS